MGFGGGGGGFKAQAAEPEEEATTAEADGTTTAQVSEEADEEICTAQTASQVLKYGKGQYGKYKYCYTVIPKKFKRFVIKIPSPAYVYKKYY